MSSFKNFICKQSRFFYLINAQTKSNNNFMIVFIYKYILEASFMPSNKNTNNCREDSPKIERECRVQSDQRVGARATCECDEMQTTTVAANWRNKLVKRCEWASERAGVASCFSEEERERELSSA